MASSSNELGYEDDRFANQVSPNFHCPICLNVLKDPVMCRRNQHHFCTGCITRHLQNSRTCPTCMDELTVETLSQTPRIYTTYLSDLQIRCDYFSRGCPEFVELGNLKTHVENCEFSPVVCSNEGCNMEINRRDILHHETEVCQLRKVKCHECVEIRKEMDDMKASLAEVKASQIETKASLTDMKASLTDMKASQTDMKASLAEVKANRAETKANLANMNDQFRLQMRCMQDEIVNKVETIMAGMKAPSQDPTADTRRHFIVAGGRGLNDRSLNSVEIFRWPGKAWVPLKPMRTQRAGLSSFVYKNQMIVAGGYTPQGYTNTMEATNVNHELGLCNKIGEQDFEYYAENITFLCSF